MGAPPAADVDLQLVHLIHDEFIFSVRCFWPVFKIRSKAVRTLFIFTSQTPCKGSVPSCAAGETEAGEAQAWQHQHQWELNLLLGGLIFLANLP